MFVVPGTELGSELAVVDLEEALAGCVAVVFVPKQVNRHDSRKELKVNK